MKFFSTVDVGFFEMKIARMISQFKFGLIR